LPYGSVQYYYYDSKTRITIDEDSFQNPILLNLCSLLAIFSDPEGRNVMFIKKEKKREICKHNSILVPFCKSDLHIMSK